MESKLTFKRAEQSDIPAIWKMLQAAIARRKADGSTQWQDGYPNPDVVGRDIEKRAGYVLWHGEQVAGYIAIMINDEPAYDELVGNWLSQGDYIVYHRVVVATQFLGLGFAQRLMEYAEQVALQHGIKSIKADTNFDNQPMLHLFEKLGYLYCGEVTFRGTPRKAFEKLVQTAM